MQGPGYRFVVGLVTILVPLADALFGWHLVAANVVAAVVAAIGVALIIADSIESRGKTGPPLTTLGPDLEAAFADVLKAVGPLLSTAGAKPAADTGATVARQATGATALTAGATAGSGGYGTGTTAAKG